jgi:hypothetical protein
MLGGEAEQAAAMQTLASEHLSKASSQLRTIAGNSAPNSLQAGILGLVAGMIDGTAVGMQPAPEREHRASAPHPYVSVPSGQKPVTINGADLETQCRGIQQALVSFINAHEMTPDRQGIKLTTANDFMVNKQLNERSDRCDSHGLDFKRFGLQPNPKPSQSRS